MQFVFNATRRLMFPVLMTAIVGGLWMVASECAGADKLRRDATRFAEPIVLENQRNYNADQHLVIADDGSIATYDDPT